MKLRKIVGILKDNATLSRAMARSESSTLSVAILRATSHEEAPPQERHVAAILSAGGSSSRLRVARCVAELLKRLRKTRSWAVALKSLIVVHRALREGSFIFQDQISALRPLRSDGGRNHLNLSDFSDHSTLAAWQASSWVRCYATYVDQWLHTCRVLGDFLGRCGATKSTVAALTSAELAADVAAVRDLLAAACECCHLARSLSGNAVVGEGLRLVLADTWQLQEEVVARLEEVRERMAVLQPAEARELLKSVQALEVQEKALRDVIIMKDLKGPECAHGTLRVEDLLPKVREGLRAVAEFKPLVTGAVKGRKISQSARFDRHTFVTSFRSTDGRMEGGGGGGGAAIEFASSTYGNCWRYNGVDSLI